MAWCSCTSYRERSSENPSDSSSQASAVEVYKEGARYRATRHQGPAWALPLGELPATNCASQIRQRGKCANNSSPSKE